MVESKSAKHRSWPSVGEPDASVGTKECWRTNAKSVHVPSGLKVKPFHPQWEVSSPGFHSRCLWKWRPSLLHYSPAFASGFGAKRRLSLIPPSLEDLVALCLPSGHFTSAFLLPHASTPGCLPPLWQGQTVKKISRLLLAASLAREPEVLKCTGHWGFSVSWIKDAFWWFSVFTYFLAACGWYGKERPATFQWFFY